ncbi:hypothetical protein NUW54_g1695 [Trametes sanguinea]|uniref:Uncharacterized protein n=1 Tax=Trametes sanguinea TaxID=158606 RepID=A0ACC1Q7H7_9APHY|nr:hypothetical protein NUW54_g1695 [Trametes sanguinea]
MYLRLAIAFHLLLALIELTRSEDVALIWSPAEGAPFPQSMSSESIPRQSLVSWILLGVIIRRVSSRLQARMQGAPRMGLRTESRHGLCSLSISAFWDVYTSLIRGYDHCDGLQRPTNEAPPGAWHWAFSLHSSSSLQTDGEDEASLCGSLESDQETLLCSKRSSDPLHSSSSLGLCSGCAEDSTPLDSGTSPDKLTLHAGDIALLGNYLARTRGMFAWRVYPLSNLSSDPSRSLGAHIVQRIDAFFKPVGRAVHHVELVLEWTFSAAADFSFLVREALASPSAKTAPADIPSASPSVPIPASHSEKAIAALALAMANGAVGISDYEALRASEGLASLDETHVGDLWN